MFVVDDGHDDCHVTEYDGEYNGMCVTDGYGESHENNERCTIRAQHDLYVWTYYFETESGDDYITMPNGDHYWGTVGLHNYYMNAERR